MDQNNRRQTHLTSSTIEIGEASVDSTLDPNGAVFTVGGVGGGGDQNGLPVNRNVHENRAFIFDEFCRQDSQYSTQSLRSQETLERVPNLDHYRMSVAHVDVPPPIRAALSELHVGHSQAYLQASPHGMPTPASIGDFANVKAFQLQAHPDKKESQKSIKDAAKKSTAPQKLDWLQGVLMRCVLNILGVMLYLRLSWVAGQAGIGLGSAIILLSSLVTVITSLSMCAVATNGEVKGGGIYFLISRSMGPEFGGSIGIIFTLANAVGGAMYIVGFSETVRDLMRRSNVCIVDCAENDIRIVSWATAFLLLGIIIMGVSFETKAQIVLMVVLVISLISYFVGTFLPATPSQKSKGVTGYSTATFVENFTPAWRGYGFFDVFAVYFPAATGIMAGANISGDLKDAQKSIPKGTLLAILLTTLLYLACLWTTGATCIRDATGELDDYYNGTLTNCSQRNQTECEYGLMNYFQVMEMESAFGPLVTAGIFAATLSSALASLVSAPKVFQALGRDRVYPYIDYFAKGFGRNDEPRRGYLLFFMVAIAVIAIGDLNIIAPYISNFFLASYCLVNYACFDASFAESPGFRPSFRYYNMWLSLFGAALCVGVMFVINWKTALITFVFVAVLYVYILRRQPDVNWGSSNQAMSYRSALQQMLKLQFVPQHIKTYRPQILLMSGNPAERPALVDFASNVTKDIGLLICGHVISEDQDGETNALSAQEINKGTLQWLKKRKIASFYYPIVSPNLASGAHALMQLCGMSRLKPDVVFMGFKNNWLKCSGIEIQHYFEAIRYAFDLQMGVGILRIRSGFNVSNTLRMLKLADDAETINGSGTVPVTLELPASPTTPSMQDVHRWSSMAYNTRSAPDLGNIADLSLELLKRCKKPGYHKRLHKHFQKKRDSEEDQHEAPEKVKYARLLTVMNQFRGHVKNGLIDVYWLFDDGGLTMLVPHLLTVPKSYLEDAKIRIFTASVHKDTIDKEKLNMINLLRKFRITFVDVIVADIGRKPHQSTIRDFRDMIDPVMLHRRSQDERELDENGDRIFITEDELAATDTKTCRQLRIREIILEYSRQSSLVVIPLPVPRKGTVSACLYMAWLEVLSQKLPPVLLLRGNQRPVLTFYS